MKRTLALILLFLFGSFFVGANTIRPPKGLVNKVWNSTLALYGTLGSVTHFDCTAEVIAKSRDGYTLLTAGHCVQEVPFGLKFSVADEIGGGLSPVTLVKAYEGTGTDPVDFALFNLKTTKHYEVLALGPDDILHVGDLTINVHFAEGLGKQLSYGQISSQPLVKSDDCVENGCIQNYLVQEYAGPGASGSAVISAKTHRIIGILVEQTSASLGLAIEPISRLSRFKAGPNQPHRDAATAQDDPSLRIPEAVYKTTFGPEHPFTLTVTGPNPRFEQAGYTFVVIADGMELSDEYYYQVPVFIGEAEDGTFRLVSTKQGYSVGVAVVKGPEPK